MRITCISDLHGHLPQLDSGDLLIVAGDLTARDTPRQHEAFLSWMYHQNYSYKVFIAGNHDGFLVKNSEVCHLRRTAGYDKEDTELQYLSDSGCEVEGLRIWGSPWTPTFYNWHFMKDRGAPIKEKWDLIPPDTDILVTHGPPFGILDKVAISSKGNRDGFAGCEELRLAIERIQPRLHVFGHVHEGYGQMTLKCTPRDVLCVNASIMNENYRPVNKPITIELKI